VRENIGQFLHLSQREGDPKLFEARQPQAGENSAGRIAGVTQFYQRLQRDDLVRGDVLHSLTRDADRNPLKQRRVGEEPKQPAHTEWTCTLRHI